MSKKKSKNFVYTVCNLKNILRLHLKSFFVYIIDMVILSSDLDYTQKIFSEMTFCFATIKITSLFTDIRYLIDTLDNRFSCVVL